MNNKKKSKNKSNKNIVVIMVVTLALVVAGIVVYMSTGYDRQCVAQVMYDMNSTKAEAIDTCNTMNLLLGN